MRTQRLIGILGILLGILIGFGGMSACTSVRMTADSDDSTQHQARVTPVADDEAFTQAINELLARDVIFIGETHDRYGHHLNQLAVIRALHNRGEDIAIGMEFFQRPFQAGLDAYIDGESSEKTMLKDTEYYLRWRYDFRLYRPILDFAREHGIPVVALNAPTELVKQVSQHGWSGVDDKARAQLPAIAVPPDHTYELPLREVYAMHLHGGDGGFERFMQVQLLWDEYMAESAANYLRKNPSRKLVVLAGSGHVRGGSGIPERLRSRLSLELAVVLSGRAGEVSRGTADLVLLDEFGKLPRPGRLGLQISAHGKGVVVKRVGAELRPQTSDVSAGDRILSIAGERIATLEDVRLAMLDRSPGEQIWLELERSDENDVARLVSMYVELI